MGFVTNEGEKMRPSIYSLTRQDLIDWTESKGEKKFRATQIWE